MLFNIVILIMKWPILPSYFCLSLVQNAMQKLTAFTDLTN